MKSNTIQKEYAGYVINIFYSPKFLDYTFWVINEHGFTVLVSNRPYDSVDDCYVRACTRINDEL
jgi:hypothetical protein